MLVEALDTFNESHWRKPNPANRIFDNGAYFNLCKKWVDYKKGINDNERCSEMVSFRILHGFGQFSKIQIPKNNKSNPEIKRSEKPTLN